MSKGKTNTSTIQGSDSGVQKCEQVCRACMAISTKEAAQSLHMVHAKFAMKYSELLMQCAGVSVDDSDSLPHSLCSKCFLELPSAWAFVSLCRSSDAALRLRRPQTDVEPVPALVKLEPDDVPPASPPDYLKYETGDSVESPARSDENEYLKTVTLHPKKIKLKKLPLSSKKDSKFSCSECGHLALTELQYKKHVKSEHPELEDLLIAYRCTTCGKVFKRKSDLRVHTRIHSGEKPFACQYCPRRFTQSGSLIEHVRHHTGETPFQCKVCHKAFSSRSSYWRHRRVHSRERPYACESCGRAFGHSSTLRTHMLVHSEARPFACVHCGHSAKSKYALSQHACTHGEKAYVCERCGKKFALKSNLDSHTRKMHSSRSGRCNVCGRDASDLTRHMQRHAADSPFRCGVCSRSFRLASALSFHQRFHADAGKFRCSVAGCDETFPKRNMLQFHTRKHHSNETPHVCALCSKGFFRISDLSRHTNTAHPEPSPPGT